MWALDLGSVIMLIFRCNSNLDHRNSQSQSVCVHEKFMVDAANRCWFVYIHCIGNSADSDDSSDTSKRMVNQDDYHKEIKDVKVRETRTRIAQLYKPVSFF